MFDALGQALLIYCRLDVAATLLLSVLAGLIIGIIPGVGGMVGLAIFLPMVIFVPPEVGLTFLVAMHATVYQGASIPAILINVPGSGGAVATLLDGYPMAQRGEGARAVGAALTASGLGGIMPVFLALAMVPLLLSILSSFRSSEMVFMILLGLVCMGALVTGSVIKGLTSGCLGLLLSLIGFHGTTGVYRFTFGTVFLSDGLDTISIVLGIFGVSEMFDILIKKQTAIVTGTVKTSLRDVFQGAKDVFRYKWTWLRSTLIGYVIGIIPAVGGETAIWVAYGTAKQLSKHPEKFGTGFVEGVIAPESANNAKEAGSMLTTMAFGIPGSMPAVLILSAFMIVGISPGPSMMSEKLPLALTLLVGIALSNLLGTTIAMFATPSLAKLSSLHIDYLFPVIMTLVYIGAFVKTLAAEEVFVTFIFGLIGFACKRFGYSRPALILGFVLGNMLELYLLRSITIFGPMFFLTPICLFLLAVAVGILLYPSLMKRRFASRVKEARPNDSEA